MSDLLSIARRFLSEPGEKGDKGEKSSARTPFAPLSPFPPAPALGTSPPILVGWEAWDQRTAMLLVLDADTLVERLEVDGRLPAIQDAATMVVSALATRDMETVRFAVGEFAAAVRAAAAPQNRPAVPATT